jgi:CCR4-NOT transcription complex subunit 4
MVYLIGLPAELADEAVLILVTQLLGQFEYCGQYGIIRKVLVKENHFNEFRSYCAYVTYAEEDSAALAVLVRDWLMQALNNFVFDGSRIYASYGTNKYCSAFVRFGKCKKAECPFLHTIERHKEIR